MFALLMLNVERLLALSYPYFHQRAVTKTRIKLCFVFWMIVQVGISALLPFFGLPVAHALITVFVFLFLYIFVSSNYKMFVIVKSKREDKRIVPADRATSSNQERKKRMVNFKNISTCLLAAGCYFICSLPQLIYSSWRTTSHKPWNDSELRLFAIWCNTFLFYELDIQLSNFFLEKFFYLASGRNEDNKLLLESITLLTRPVPLKGHLLHFLNYLFSDSVRKNMLVRVPYKLSVQH